jgi:Undecaprenyl-phosphate glucose phosphotransferase
MRNASEIPLNDSHAPGGSPVAGVVNRRGTQAGAPHPLGEYAMHLPTSDAAAARLRQPGIRGRVADAAVIVCGALLAAPHGGKFNQAGFESAVVAYALLFAFITFPALGLYHTARRHPLRWCVCVPALAWLAVVASAVLLVAAAHRAYRPELAWIARWALLSGMGIVACRLLGNLLGARRTDQDAGRLTVAIVGNGAHCRQLIRKVDLAAESRYRVTTIFDTGPEDAADAGGVPAFRDRSGFAAYVRRYRVDELWLALPLSQERTILEFTRLFRNDLINVRFIPDMRGLALFDGEMVDLDGTSAINLVGSPLSSQALVKKEIFDRVFSLFALLALSPVLLAVACAVKFTSRGPVLFTQRRKGANGKVFNIYKFRSMRVHAAAEGVVKQATRNDPRVTRVGAFLRRTSLDELPQFFNVLRGEMSVVGPRPHAIEHDALYQNIVDGYIHRYRIKPGITGWAQVNGFRGETDTTEKMQGRVERDLYYLSNWSFALDMRIVLMTIGKGLVHRNAY